MPSMLASSAAQIIGDTNVAFTLVILFAARSPIFNSRKSPHWPGCLQTSCFPMIIYQRYCFLVSWLLLKSATLLGTLPASHIVNLQSTSPDRNWRGCGCSGQLLPTRILIKYDDLIDEIILGKNTILIASGWGMITQLPVFKIKFLVRRRLLSSYFLAI